MGTFKTLIGAWRSRKALQASGPPGMGPGAAPGSLDIEALQAMAANRGNAADPAAHMRALADAGLVMKPSLDPSDPRLQPIDGMTFEAYVELVAGNVAGASDGDLEAAGAALGMAPGATTPAFENWSNKVVGDQELGVHYTAALQSRLAKGDG